MALLSVREAARRLSVDERTIRRWIVSGRLASQHAVNGRMLIDEGEVERALLESQSGPPPQATLDLGLLMAKVNLMQSEMETMRQRIEYLEARAGPREKKQVAPPRPAPDVTPSSEKPLPLWPEASELEDAQPPGTISLQDLADELGISRTTLLGHVLNPRNKLQHIPIAIPGRQGQFKRYFDVDQAELVRVWYESHSRKR
jgi:excisionase family DNA binding protein